MGDLTRSVYFLMPAYKGNKLYLLFYSTKRAYKRISSIFSMIKRAWKHKNKANEWSKTLLELQSFHFLFFHFSIFFLFRKKGLFLVMCGSLRSLTMTSFCSLASSMLLIGLLLLQTAGKAEGACKSDFAANLYTCSLFS